jgi:hypothetical protein
MDINERNEGGEHSQRLGALVQGTLCVAVCGCRTRMSCLGGEGCLRQMPTSLSQSPIPKTRPTIQDLSSESSRLALPSYIARCSLLPAASHYCLVETVITCTVICMVWSNAVLVVPPRSNHDPAQNRQLNLELESPAISYNNPF